MRSRLTVVSVLMATTALHADRVADLVRIHTEAMGGMERITSLVALRATGHVTAAGKQVQFTMIAARPNRVRIETESGGRTLVQGTDGVEPAWEFDPGTSPPKYRAMADRMAKTFVADAEFDDPLVAGVARGYGIDFAGEIEVEGRKLFRLLITRRMQEPFSVLLDPSTYLIVRRIEQRATAAGRKIPVVTQYGDFRPVEGVLLPHEIITSIDGRLAQQTRIDRIEANPTVSASMFTRPLVAPSGVETR